MSHHNHFFFLRTLWGALRHADWKEAAARAGILGLIVEFFRAIAGFSAWPFFVPADSEWQPSAIRPILNEHGIPHWGWGKQSGEFFFQVKLRQANWAQYLLQQHGVPLSGQLLDEGGRSAYRPAARRSLRPAGGAAHTAANPATQREATPSLLADPVGQINRTVDRLAKW
ncbi:MAG: hypothetical protein IT328_11630 [Caldilineaceae bacterium]|nr:hypothetical protein [Caldilineaceae bacterium]